MSRLSCPALILTGALLGCGVLLSSCMLPPARGAGALRAAADRHTLNRPFEDFYDTAFVLTDAGRSAPRLLNPAQVARALADYDVVFYGESHGHPGVHLQEMKLLRALHAHDPRRVISFEQFERDVQGVIDDYLAARIGETTLIDKGHAWNNYAASYRPLMLFAREHHLPVVAAEAPDWTVGCVGQWGTGILDQFTPLERSWVAAELHVGPGAYRDNYMKFMGSSAPHGAGDASPAEAAAKAQRSFAAQVTRDDTMAESIHRALQQHPGYKLLHLTGSFHAHGFLGTVERLRLRDPKLRIAVIDPVEVEDPKAPSFGADEVDGGTVLELIYPNPEAFAKDEDTSAATQKMTHAHQMSRCKYSPASAAPSAVPAAAPAPQGAAQARSLPGAAGGSAFPRIPLLSRKPSLLKRRGAGDFPEKRVRRPAGCGKCAPPSRAVPSHG